ncbi:XRE family transcriptional regulator [Apilactobacillus timberlakei]|uniref:XRE family transcriptional regulator n=1 Tax=Apilactobacillus timberlakei TaxID=2008380 RepID=UPI00112B4B0A|nr:XRE family transcriptional regulator [Apilactobacillus timberlakei]TPR21473.1 XRE family transcriptional regulator [Apilactobacillus timberlakei]
MNKKIRISLKAARVNANMTQLQAAESLSDYTGIYITKDRIRYFEQYPEYVPDIFGKSMSRIYGIPVDNIFFGSLSTKSCRKNIRI